jgi:hypothetical protein
MLRKLGVEVLSRWVWILNYPVWFRAWPSFFYFFSPERCFARRFPSPIMVVVGGIPQASGITHLFEFQGKIAWKKQKSVFSEKIIPWF